MVHLPHHQRLAIVKPDASDPDPAPASALAPADALLLLTLMASVLDTVVRRVARLESRTRALEAQRNG